MSSNGAKHLTVPYDPTVAVVQSTILAQLQAYLVPRSIYSGSGMTMLFKKVTCIVSVQGPNRTRPLGVLLTNGAKALTIWKILSCEFFAVMSASGTFLKSTKLLSFSSSISSWFGLKSLKVQRPGQRRYTRRHSAAR